MTLSLTLLNAMWRRDAVLERMLARRTATTQLWKQDAAKERALWNERTIDLRTEQTIALEAM